MTRRAVVSILIVVVAAAAVSRGFAGGCFEGCKVGPADLLRLPCWVVPSNELVYGGTEHFSCMLHGTGGTPAFWNEYTARACTVLQDNMKYFNVEFNGTDIFLDKKWCSPWTFRRFRFVDAAKHAFSRIYINVDRGWCVEVHYALPGSRVRHKFALVHLYKINTDPALANLVKYM